jgi:hypothetical protein
MLNRMRAVDVREPDAWVLHGVMDSLITKGT